MSNKTGYVYVLQNPKTKEVKIGMSIKPEKRMKAIGSQAGFKSSKNQIFGPFIDAYEVEQSLHQYFTNYRVEGEWFSISFNDVVSVVRRTAGNKFVRDSCDKKNKGRYVKVVERIKGGPIEIETSKSKKKVDNSYWCVAFGPFNNCREVVIALNDHLIDYKNNDGLFDIDVPAKIWSISKFAEDKGKIGVEKKKKKVRNKKTTLVEVSAPILSLSERRTILIAKTKKDRINAKSN